MMRFRRIHGAGPLSVLVLTLLGLGCAGARESLSAPAPVPNVARVESLSAGLPGEQSGPAPVLGQLQAAVQRRDLPQVRKAFCDSFQPILAGWERQLGPDAVLEVFSQRLSFPACPGGYRVMTTRSPAGAVWLSDYEEWQDAWIAVSVAKKDTSVESVEVRYCGLDWRLESGAWRLKQW